MNVFVIVLFVSWALTAGIAMYFIRKNDNLLKMLSIVLAENRRLFRKIRRVREDPFPEFSLEREAIKDKCLLDLLELAQEGKNPTSDGEDTRK